MASKDIFVPDLGDFKDVAVIEVLVKAGDSVQVDAPLLTLETGVKKEKLSPILLYGGFPLSAKQVVDAIEASGETSAIDSETNSNAPELTTE